MSNENNKLSEQLWKTYLLRSTAGLLCFTVTFFYLNNIFTSSVVQYSDQARDISFSNFKEIIISTQNTLDSIAAVVDKQVTQNYLQNSGIFCQSNLQFEECNDYLESSTKNSIVYDTVSTFLSFRCLSGTCSEVASLWDYFWTFNIRFEFIQYIFIQYQSNITNSLVIPALENITISENNKPDQWLLSYFKDTLILSKHYTDFNVTTYAEFNRAILLDFYQIDLNSFNLSLQITFQQTLPQMTYNSDNTAYSLELIPYNTGMVFVLAIVTLFLVCEMQNLMIKWQQRNFKNIQALESLYRNQLHSIFTNKLPYNSTILCQSPLSVFFEDLSQIIDEHYTSMSLHEVEVQKQQPFKFLPLLQKIKTKFQVEMRLRQQERNNDISDLKYQIKTAVGDISDSVQKNFKEAFVRARELQLSSVLFYNAYLSLILSLERFEQRLKIDNCVLPESIISLLRYMNFTINSEDLKFVFKFAFAFTKVIEDEILMRLHFTLQQKYLSILRQHDFENKFAIQLGLERELRYLQDSIENKRYIITTYLK